VLPLLLFVFSMALGEDYNILVMSRIREEAHHAPTLSAALTREQLDLAVEAFAAVGRELGVV